MAIAVQAGVLLLLASAFYTLRMGLVRTHTRLRRRYLRKFVSLSNQVEPGMEEMMQAAGFPIRIRALNIGRLSFLTLALAFTLPVGHIRTAILAVLLTLASAPRLTWFSLRSPFALALSYLTCSRKRRMMRELYRAAGILKNLALAERDPPGALAILEHLKHYCRELSPTFARIISLWSIGRREEGAQVLREAVDAKAAEAFVQLIVKLDQLEPNEFLPTIRLFQERFLRERETARMKKNRIRKAIMLGFASISAICVLLNFIVVGVAIDLLKQLSTIG